MTPKRIQMSRQKPWRADNPDAVIVARPSLWGNPFLVKEWGLELSIALYRNMVSGVWSPNTLGQERSDEEFSRAYSLQEDWSRRMRGHPLENIGFYLTGHDLACWCPTDQPCHADVLLEIANS